MRRARVYAIVHRLAFRPQTSVVAVVNEVARRSIGRGERGAKSICVLDVSVLVYMGFVCVMYV